MVRWDSLIHAHAAVTGATSSRIHPETSDRCQQMRRIAADLSRTH
jgi:hypothetical protein